MPPHHILVLTAVPGVAVDTLIMVTGMPIMAAGMPIMAAETPRMTVELPSRFFRHLQIPNSHVGGVAAKIWQLRCPTLLQLRRPARALHIWDHQHIATRVQIVFPARQGQRVRRDLRGTSYP